MSSEGSVRLGYAARDHGEITSRCEAQDEHLGRTTQVWAATVFNAQGRRIALFRCTQMILSRAGPNQKKAHLRWQVGCVKSSNKGRRWDGCWPLTLWQALRALTRVGFGKTPCDSDAGTVGAALSCAYP